MSAISGLSSAPTRSRLRRLLTPFAIVIAAVLVATGLRTGLGMYANYQVERAQAEAQQVAHTPMPTSPAIEQGWGIRVTLVQLLADGGLIELRYLVVDSTKSARLHEDPNSLKNIPWMKVDGTDLSIKSKSVMFHFQHGVGQGADGRTYSIIYGNANNAVHRLGLVTVVMPDGLELQHVPVAG
jgi:hypothetical protein